MTWLQISQYFLFFFCEEVHFLVKCLKCVILTHAMHARKPENNLSSLINDFLINSTFDSGTDRK